MLSRAALVLAVAYFISGGVLALWFPANGIDLYASYTAGAAARSGSSPYERAVYIETWDRLGAPRAVADSRRFAFAYPPSWIPLAMGLSLLPWGRALACWKLVSTACLIGIVLLARRVLYVGELGDCDRLALWCFALTLSPAISVLAVGQSSLLIVFLIVLSAACLERGRVLASGLALALAVMKPQLGVAYVLLLVARGEVTVLAIAAAGNAALTALGVYASGARLDTYLEAAAHWARDNQPTSEIAVGIATLLGHGTSLDVTAATAIGLLAGVALVAALALGRRAGGDPRALAEVLPIVLLAAPLAFRCNAYDLVALIPLFAWARAHGTPRALGRAIQALCLVLIVPRAGLRLVYETVAAGLVPYEAYHVGEVTFRTWVLVLLLPLALLAWRARALVPARHPPP